MAKPEKPRPRARRPAPLRARKPAKSPAAPTVTLESGLTLALDGDLVFLIDALYREFAVKRGFAPAYAEVQKEIGRLLGQMGPAATREYFAASLFLNYVTYENEMADRLADAITEKARRLRSRS